MRLIPSYPIYSVTSYNTFILITPITDLCLLHCLNYVLQSNNNPHNSFPSSVATLSSPPTRTSASSSASRRYSLTQHSLQLLYKTLVTQLPQSPLKSSSPLPPPSSPPLFPRKAASFMRKKQIPCNLQPIFQSLQTHCLGRSKPMKHRQGARLREKKAPTASHPLVQLLMLLLTIVYMSLYSGWGMMSMMYEM